MKNDWLKSGIQNCRQEAFLGSFLTVKMTHLPLDHHSVYRISPIVFILSEHVAKYDNMPYSPSQNWSPEGNGVHFMFGVVSRPIFSEESHGADHFLKKGAQHAHLGPFWAHFGPAGGSK